MSYPWGSPLNKSSGFVYFNANNTLPSPVRSSQSPPGDFISFNQSPSYSQCNSFSSGYRRSPNTSFQRGSQSFRGRNSGRNNFRYHNKSQEQRYSNNFNRSFNNRRQHSKGNTSFDGNGKQGTSIYYDPTCMVDPWAELEKDLKETTPQSQPTTGSPERSPVVKNQGENLPSPSNCQQLEMSST